MFSLWFCKSAAGGAGRRVRGGAGRRVRGGASGQELEKWPCVG